MESFIHAADLPYLDFVYLLQLFIFYSKKNSPPIILIIVFHELVGVDSGDTIHVPEGGNAAGSGGQPGSLYIKIKAIFCPNILTLTCATCWSMNLRF